MDLKDIARTLDARNEGEDLLVEISNALNAGEQPSKASIQKLSKAVDAMLSREDTKMRLYLLQLRLGLLSPGGRPLIEKNIKKQEQGARMAEAYWRHRFHGCKKGEAREKVWEEFQPSGEFDDRKSFPCPDTVKNNVERYPQQAMRVFYAWRILRTPSEKEVERVVDEIKVHLKKHQEKTP